MTENAQKVQKPADVSSNKGKYEAEQSYPEFVPTSPSITLGHLDALNPDSVLQLQRLIGNQALLRMIQRQQTTPASPAALTAPQIESARRRFEAQSRRYTPQIIQQIEGVIERPQDGLIDDEDIQAIARFQQAHPPLEVDGFAGPHTLPIMFPFGLAEQESIETYTGEFIDLRSQWGAMTPAERLDHLRGIISQRMTDAGVTPADIIEYDFGSARTEGAFDYTSWILRINRRLLNRDRLEDSDARALMETIYHEARHGEQYFTIARWLAGQGMGADAIRLRMRLNDLPTISTMLQAAIANPIQPNTPEALIAQDWYSSYYGRHEEETSDTYGDVDRRSRQLDEAEIEHSLSPADPAATTREERAEERFDSAFEDYRDLPMEFDAHHLDDRLSETYSQQTGRGPEGEMVDEALAGTGLLH